MFVLQASAWTYFPIQMGPGDRARWFHCTRQQAGENILCQTGDFLKYANIP